MLKRLMARAKDEGLHLAPFVGIGCPGKINADGSIETGAQNLPGNWESSRFNLPASIYEAIPKIGDFETAILMHNDAGVQGLSEVPFMQDVENGRSSPSAPASATLCTATATQIRCESGPGAWFRSSIDHCHRAVFNTRSTGVRR